MINSLIFFIVFAAHEFYVSIMDVDYSKKEHSIQVTKKIFFDDLEHALVLFTKNQELDILAYNQDSLKPMINYLRADIIHIMETLEWKN